MIIREIRQEDNAQIEIIMRACFLEFDLPVAGSSLEDIDVLNMYKGFKAENAVYYVLEEQGEILGGGGIKQLKGGDKETCELQKMYFHQKARGKGYGKLMFDKCINSAIQLGFKFCYLESASQLKSAIKLYELNGFKNLKKPLGKTGHVICGVWMIKKLI